MATPVWLNGWENGVVSDRGGGLSASIAGTPTIDTVIFHSGTRSLRCTTVGTTTINARSKNFSAGLKIAVMSVYVYFRTGAFPDATTVVVGFIPLTAGGVTGISITSGRVARGVVGTGTPVVGPTLSENTWHKIDMRFNISASTWTLDWEIDQVPQTQATLTGQATNDSVSYARFGSASSTVNMDVNFDDAVLSETSADFPLPETGIVILQPASDGTHNAGTNIMEDQAGNDIGVVTAYDKVDDVPMSLSTTYIQQLANGTGNYAEIVFGLLSASRTGIIGAMGILAYTSNTTTANNGATIMSKDSFSTNTSIHGTPAVPADMSEGSLSDIYYKTAIIQGAVNDATVNFPMKARVGYSGDAAPDPYWVNLAIEVAYIPGAPPAQAAIPVYMNQYRQRRN